MSDELVKFRCFLDKKVRKQPREFMASVKDANEWVLIGIGEIVPPIDPFADLAEKIEIAKEEAVQIGIETLNKESESVSYFFEAENDTVINLDDELPLSVFVESEIKAVEKVVEKPVEKTVIKAIKNAINKSGKRGGKR